MPASAPGEVAREKVIHMKRFVDVVVVVLGIVVLAVGCGTSRQGASRTSEAASALPAADVSGKWTGRAGTGVQDVPASMELKQEGTAVRGNLIVGTRPDLNGPVEGVISGDTVRIKIASGFGPTGQLRVTQGGRQLEGTVGGTNVRLQRAP